MQLSITSSHFFLILSDKTTDEQVTVDIQIFEKTRWKVFVLGLVYVTQELIKYGTIKKKYFVVCLSLQNWILKKSHIWLS